MQVIAYTVEAPFVGLPRLVEASFIGLPRLNERALCYATLFGELLIVHLPRGGVDLNTCRIQTDQSILFLSG